MHTRPPEVDGHPLLPDVQRPADDVEVEAAVRQAGGVNVNGVGHDVEVLGRPARVFLQGKRPLIPVRPHPGPCGHHRFTW